MTTVFLKQQPKKIAVTHRLAPDVIEFYEQLAVDISEATDGIRPRDRVTKADAIETAMRYLRHQIESGHISIEDICGLPEAAGKKRRRAKRA